MIHVFYSKTVSNIDIIKVIYIYIYIMLTFWSDDCVYYMKCRVKDF